MANKGRITREATVHCGKLNKGDVVFEYSGITYGCVPDTDIAVTDEPDKLPFYAIPKDAVEWEEKSAF